MPLEEMELNDDKDSLESMVGPSGTMEAARMNSDPYDAYASPGSCAFPSILATLLTELTPSLPSLRPAIFFPGPPHLRHMLRSATS
jgi:hypothetical protein